MLASLALAAALYDPTTGAKTLDRGLLSAPLSGDLSLSARAWALSRRGELGLPPDSTLVVGPIFGTRFGASIHLEQQLDGVEVYGANAVVTLDEQARVVLFTSSLVNYREARKTWLIGDTEAIARAAQQTPLPALRDDGTPYGAAKKVYLQVGDEVHAGWLVHVPSVDVRLNPYFAIDATTGATVQRWNRVFHAALDANAYAPTPGGLDGGVGVTPTVTVSLTHDDGGSMLAPGATVLRGTQLDAFNCCTVAGCDITAPNAAPRRVRGNTTLNFGIMVPLRYDIPACDFQQWATNDVARHDAGSFEYTPYDPPRNFADGGFDYLDPAASDAFSEVHAFYQVNRVYDWMRKLSRQARPFFPNNMRLMTPFSMRDERRMPARKPALWTNLVFPNLLEALSQGFPPPCLSDMDAGCVISNFGRLDNAAFSPVEQFAQIPLPEYRNDVDTLMIFQGNLADFGYDSTVLWHEFGHGAIYSTAGLGLDRLSVDQRSANNEGGALHEGLSDYISGAFGGDPFMGRYVGPRIGGGAGVIGVRTEPFLRDLDNTLACPEVLNGEVHDDGRHVAGAFWRARQDLFQGTDNGETFDAMFYAMLVGVSMQANFAQVAAVMTNNVERAFPDAGQAMAAIFDARGVTNCSKVLDVTGQPARPTFGIGARSQTAFTSGAIPGPYQLRVRTPMGAASVQVSARVGSGDPLGGILGGNQTRLRALVRAGSPISFTPVNTILQNDSQVGVDVAVAAMTGAASANIPLTNVPCGPASDVYVAIANDGMGAVTLQDLRVQVTPLASCPMGGDAGTTMDAGMTGTDGGPVNMTKVLDPIGTVDGPAIGCGCGASPAAGALLGLLLIAALRRRRP